MIEIKVTNGEEIRNYDNAHFTMFVVEIARMLKNHELDEIQLCRWLGTNINENKLGVDKYSMEIRKIQKGLFFDVDEVVGSLELLIEDNKCWEGKDYYAGQISAYETAIEIIKAGVIG